MAYSVDLSEVVLAFLADRRCASVRAALQHLYDKPDLTNEEHNNLRCAALVSRKWAMDWLSLSLVQYDDEGLVFSSSRKWTCAPLTEELLSSGVSAFGTRFQDDVDELLNSGCCANANASRMLSGINDDAFDRLAENDRAKTIWIATGSSGFTCIEGNTRIYATILGRAKGRSIPIDDWSAYFGA